MELNWELDRLRKYSDIEAELRRAEAKHPNYPEDIFQQLAILQEEAGEVTKAVMHYHFESGTKKAITEELTQTAAMCVRMIQYLNFEENEQRAYPAR